jgi:mono/diheme cytochrome c family protein
MRRVKIILGIAIVLGIATVAIAFGSVIRYGFSAHDRPTAIEEMFARAARRWAAPADLRDRKNPVLPAPEVLANARAHFADHCAICHGNDGKGNTEIGQHLYPGAPDMTLARTQNLSDGELFSIIENGIRLTGMPGWGDGTAASAKGSWELVHLIRHLPRITPQEIAEMEKLNPKSPEEWQQMQAEDSFLAGADAAPEPAASPSRPTHQH